MKRAKVFFTPATEAEPIEALAAKAVALATKAGFGAVVVPGRPCAIKLHFGEGQNTGYVKPGIAAAIGALVAKAEAQPFVTDTNTLYRGRRSQAVDHLAQAAEHGFTQEALGMPVLIADGLLGTDQVSVPIEGGRRFQVVRIASALHQAASAIVLTHVKGHCEMGFAGSIKNVGMGCAARAGKLAQHQGGTPRITAGKCQACGTCVTWCPEQALVREGAGGPRKAGEKKAHPSFVVEKCIGCGECLAVCPAEAITFSWDTGGAELAEKVCEHALGFTACKAGHVGYLNVLLHITRNCDCMGGRQKVERPDIGLLASTDLVAVDKASADLCRKTYGEDIWAAWWPDSKYEEQFRYGAALGLGTMEYDLETV